jgi:CRISPR system Cascade subunit CasE
MFYFSSIKLRSERGATGALATYLAGNAEVVGQSHQLVWSLFSDKQTDSTPSDARQRHFLYRMTGIGPSDPILVYSREPLVDPHNLWQVNCRTFSLLDSLQRGDHLAWSLRVNATVKSGNKRHDLVMHARRAGDRSHWDEIAQKVVPPWVAERLNRGGLDVDPREIVVESYIRRKFAHDPRARGGSSITLATTDLRGVGTVSDPDALCHVLGRGVGAGLAYGCGLLLVRRVQQ